MSDLVTRGMILSAGFGTRLKPLTNTVPKALTKVGGRPVIEYNIRLLKNAGIKEVVINLHHLGDKIRAYLGDGSRYGLKFFYSDEKEILGTGGGIRKAKEKFKDEPFVVLNCDMVSDINLKRPIGFHLKEKAVVTLVLRPLQAKEKYTPIAVEGNRIAAFGRGDMMYTGIQIISPAVLNDLLKNSFSNIVTDLYMPMLKEKKPIHAFIFDGFWDEIGTIDKLSEVDKKIENGEYPIGH